MSRFVRSSKYRHVFGKAARQEDQYIGIKLTKTAWDSNYVKVNPKFLSVAWETGGGGAVGVIPLGNTGKLANVPLVAGHKGPVLDFDWNPFNDNLLATASEDCYVKIWKIPDGGLTSNLGQSDSVQDLRGHTRKVGTADFNPVANNVLATSATDYSLKLWDIEKGADLYTVNAAATAIIQSVAWNHNGSLIALTAKDKKIRLLDPRGSKVVAEAVSHEGVKGARCCWLGNKELIFSVGFAKSPQRQYAIWDPRDLSKPVVSPTNIDSSAGILMPFYDPDTGCLFLAGKGDGNIRYYEITDDKGIIYYLSEYKTNTPSKGCAALPKRGVDVNNNEIMRLYRVVDDIVEPVSFMVPRKSDMFAEDLYPDCVTDEPALSLEQWTGGENANPKTQSLAPGFVKKEKSDTFNPVKSEEPTGPKNETELKEEYEKLKKRVAYLEAEIVKKDAKIKELEGH